MPNLFETTDAAASTATTYNLGIGLTAQGVAGAGDSDWYRVNLVAGQTYTFSVIATGISTTNDDTFLRLRNASGTQIAFNDDVDGTSGQFESTITFTAFSTGAHYLDLSGFGNNSIGQYGLSAVTGTMASYDESMGAGALMSRLTWAGLGAAATVSWANRASFAGSEDAAGNAAPFSSLSASQVAAVRQALGNFSEVARLTFNEVNPGGTSNNATMLFSNYTSTTDGSGAYAVFPGSTAFNNDAGDVRLNTESISATTLPRGSYSYFAILHEIGHAVGLSHPGGYNASANGTITYDQHAQFRQDSHQYTVMSYFDESETGANFGGSPAGYPDTLLMFDILALQRLYGANMTTRTGNTIYGTGSNAGPVYNFANNTDPVFCIWDAGGVDTLNASGFAGAQRIDLNAGAFSNIRGFTGNVSIAIGAMIENAVGGSGADYMVGNAAINRLTGGLGHDIYVVNNGGDVVIETANQGTDVVIARGSYVLTAGSHVERIQTVAAAATTTMNLFGNEFRQTMTGNAGVNRFNGKGGTDVYQGQGGNDVFMFTSVTDTGVGTARDVILDFEDFGNNETIDLSGFAGTLSFVGAAGFSGANQVRAVQNGSSVLIQINVGGSLAADGEIMLTNTLLSSVNASDFLL